MVTRYMAHFTNTEIREPAVEGRFYPSSRESIFELIRQVEHSERYPVPALKDVSVYGAVLPHAGHVFCGYQTVPFFQFLTRKGHKPETFVIVHPNHTGMGAPLALSPHLYWRNASGILEVDQELANLLDLPRDEDAHRNEHSGEVLLPFINYYFGESDLKILPVCMGKQTFKTAEELAKTLYNATKMLDRKIMVLASSDFTHFLPAQEGYDQDQILLDAIFSKNPEKVEKTVQRKQINACGYGPIMSLMIYSGMNSKKYSIMQMARGHSGEVSPSHEVVDYISLLFYEEAL